MSLKGNTIVYNILTNDGTVTAITPRIYPGVVEQGAALPAIGIYTISTTPTNHKDGASGKDLSRVQVSCYANMDQQETLSTLNEAVRSAIDRATPGTYGGVDLVELRFEYQLENFNDESQVFQIDADYLVWFKR